MTIGDVIDRRNILSVLHFTTNKGALGILSSRSVKSRSLLSADQQLRHIFQPNANDRSRDIRWTGYVNLSITVPNSKFFSISRRWHREKDFWWCLFDFRPETLSHEGVLFTTTNNIYTGVAREPSEAGLEACFAQEIRQWEGRSIRRSSTSDENRTTCEQAEVLYPSQLSTNYLARILVERSEDGDELAAQLAAVNHPPVEIVEAPFFFPEES